jgi:hypothetical protein
VCAHPGCLLASQTPEDVRPQQIRYLLAYWSAPSHEAPRAPGRHRGLTSADAQLPGESSRGLLSEPSNFVATVRSAPTALAKPRGWAGLWRLGRVIRPAG